MALPQQLLPRHELTLPSNKKVIKFRPFIMKEEKILLIAKESGKEIEILDAIHYIVGACTDGAIDTATCPLFDVQYAFLQIRAKSVAEVADFVIKCGSCENKISSSIDITQIQPEMIEGHSNRINLTSTLGVVMRYPTIKHLDVLANFTSPDEVYKVIADCIETVFDKDEVYNTADESSENVLAFIDNLPISQFNKIQQFFKTMPVLRHVHKFNCPKCGKENILTLEGIESFFV